jgi:peptidoglycan/LPS O-acetylase OafA/YrhL
VPYYIFLVTFIPIIYLTQRKKITFTFLLENILVKDGIDINWLVLLFIQFAALSVFLFFIMRKSKLLFYLYLVGALLISIGLMITRFGGNYKLVMWLPWSLVLIYGYYYVSFEKNKTFLYATTVFFGAIYAFTLFTQALTHHSLVFFDNKYPPNLYYLSYGLFMLNVAIIIIQMGIFKSQVATRTISFFSKYSYSLFFVHYAVIYIVSTHYAYTRLHWSVFFVMILTISILVQGIINSIRS